MENLTCELNGVKYLLVEEMVTQNTESLLNKKLLKFDAIYQGIREVNRGCVLSNSFAIVKILVPEKNIIAWNSHKEEKEPGLDPISYIFYRFWQMLIPVGNKAAVYPSKNNENN